VSKTGRVLAVVIALIFILGLALYSMEVQGQTNTWSTPVTLSSGSAPDTFPAITQFKGKLYAFWVDESGKPMMSSSGDGGIIWSESSVFAEYSGTSYVISVTTTENYMVFFWVNRGIGFSVIYAASTSDGSVWTTVQVGSGDANYKIPSAVIGDEIWILGAQDAETSYLYRSDDGGKNWNYMISVDVPARNSTLLFNGNTMHILSFYGGSLRDYSSSDFGLNWNNTVIYSGISLGKVWAGAYENRIYVVWSGRKDASYQLMISWSDNDGIDWSSPSTITYTSGSAYNPDAIISDDGIIHLVWQDNRLGKYAIFYMEMNSDGYHILGDLEISGEGNNKGASIENSGDFVSVVWIQALDTGYSACFSRFPDMTPSFENALIDSKSIYSPIDVYVDVVDDDPLSIVALQYVDVDGASNELVMSQIGSDLNGYPRYHASIPPQNTEGNISLHIWAQDSMGNRGVSETYVVKVGDSAPPTIYMANAKTTAERLKPVTIQALVSDDHLSTVYLYYQSVFGFLEKVRMVQSGEYFQAEIPPQKDVGSMLYYVWANDTYGNEAKSREFTLQIIDTIPPRIIIAPHGIIKPDSPLIIVFSEAVDTKSAENSIVLVGMDCSFKWLNGSTVQLVPDKDMSRGTTYNIVVAKGVSDMYGNEMPETHSYEFAIESEPPSNIPAYALPLVAFLILLASVYAAWKKDMLPVTVKIKRKNKRN